MTIAALRSTRADAAALAAIHARVVGRVPRLVGLRPVDAAPGAPVVLQGAHFGGTGLLAHFGGVQTWAVPLDDCTAVAVVPSGLSGPLQVSVSRQGLRSNSVGWDGPPGGGPARVVRVEPPDGAIGVLRDDPVVVIVSHALDPASLSDDSFQVRGPAGPVPGQLRLSPDARVLVWTPGRLLDANGGHEVRVSGLRDVRGLDVEPHLSQFVPCRLSASDVMA